MGAWKRPGDSGDGADWDRQERGVGSGCWLPGLLLESGWGWAPELFSEAHVKQPSR